MSELSQAATAVAAQAMKSISTARSQAAEGLTVAEQVNANLEQVVRATSELVNLVNVVAAGTEEQSAASQDLARNVRGIRDIALAES